MNAETPSRYHHTQKGPLWLLMLMFAVIFCIVAYLIRNEPVVPLIMGVVGLVMFIMGAAFQQLTVSDEGDELSIRFGPLPLFQKRIRYVDMISAETDTTSFLDGWGIHASFRGGWVWNIRGRECVAIRHKDGMLRVGTDDAANLAQFLLAKILSGGQV